MTGELIDSVDLRETASGERLVLLHTDRGRTGVGELAVDPERSSPSAERLAALLVGRGAGDVNALLASVGGPARTAIADPAAIAAVTAAMLDLTGRRLDVPLVRLMGGQVHDRVPVCAVDWAVGVGSEEGVADAARRAVAEGFTALRVDVGDLTGVAARVARVAAVRDAVPAGTRLVVRGAAADGAIEGLELGHGVRSLDVSWLEQLTGSPTGAALRRLDDRSPVPLAAGRDARPEQLDRIAAEGRLDFLVLDPAAAGGLHMARHFAALAEIYHVHIVVAGSRGPNSSGVAMQLAAAIPNLAMVEVAPGRASVVDGMVEVDLSPGLPHPAELVESAPEPITGGVNA